MKPRKGETPEAFRERRNAYLRAVRRANPEKNRATVRAWAAANRERKQLANAAWREANRDRMQVVRAAWKKANADRIRVHNATRRARSRSSGRLSPNIVPLLMAKQSARCAACACELVEFHLDHILPLALGGSHTDDNVQLLCPPCNLRKGAMHPDDFAKQQSSVM